MFFHSHALLLVVPHSCQHLRSVTMRHVATLQRYPFTAARFSETRRAFDDIKKMINAFLLVSVRGLSAT